MFKVIDTVKADFIIDAEVMTPLLQIEPTSSSDKDGNTKASMVRTKKRRYLTEDGKMSEEPFFSANGFRGAMRRVISGSLFGEVEKKDNEKINIDTAHLYASGGGTSVDGINGLSYKEQESFRASNPYLSLFGVGLADLDGKLAVCDLSPVSKDKKLIDYVFGVRFDDTERSSIFTPLISAKSVEKYKSELLKKRGENKVLRKIEKDIEDIKKQIEANDTEDKDLLSQLDELETKLAKLVEEKGMSYQQVYKAEFIIPGTKLSSSIGTRAGHELSELERSMMLYGLIQTSLLQIGSYSRIGWGVLNWHVRDGDGKTLFKTTASENYLLNRSVEISDHGKKSLKIFEEYMNGLKREELFAA